MSGHNMRTAGCAYVGGGGGVRKDDSRCGVIRIRYGYNGMQNNAHVLFGDPTPLTPTPKKNIDYTKVNYNFIRAA